MEKRHSGNLFHEKGIYRTINAALIICMELFGGGAFLGIPELSWLHVLTAAAVLALFSAILFLEKRGRILCVLGLLLCLSAAFLAAGPEKSLPFLGSYFLWLIGKGGAWAEWALGHELLQAAALAAIGYLAQILFEKVPVLKAALAGTLLAGLILCLFAEVELPHAGVVFLLCYIVMVYAEWIQDHWVKVRSGSPRAVMPWLAPFLALYVLLSVLMPAPRDPYEWRWVKNAYNQIREVFLTYTQGIRWGNREGFDLTLSGFSEDGRLPGDIRKESREIMTVRMRDGRLSNVYLTGMLYDTFDGRQWLQTYQGPPQAAFLDAMETRAALRKYTAAYARDYLYQTRLEIRYEYFNSGYLFAPLKTWSVDMRGRADYACKNGWLVLDRRRGYGTEYALTYFQLNGGQDEFYRFIDFSRETEETEEDWQEMLREYESLTGEAVSYDSVGAYRQEISEHYLQNVPLSEEVSAYLSRITAGARTDTEKLRAIEAELSSFSYTGTPGALPAEITAESDFLDYFLLGKKEGHCTFFATAFVLLARAEGIPARYVQGFCVPMQDKAEAVVYSDMAHAWPEAYIEGAGWIPFEPTPGYGGLRYTPWQLLRPDEAADSEKAAAETPLPERKEPEPVQMTPEPSEAEEEPVRPGSFPLSILLLLPAGFVLILLADNVLGRYRWRKMGPEERFRTEVRRNLWILTLFGLHRAENETLQELRERGLALPCLQNASALAEKPVSKRRKRYRRQDSAPQIRPAGGTAQPQLQLQFIKDYEDIAYGGKHPEKEMTESAARERQLLLQLLKKGNRWLSLYCRIRLYLVRYH